MTLEARNRDEVVPASPRRNAPIAVLAGSFVLIASALLWTLWKGVASPGDAASGRGRGQVAWPRSPWKNAKSDVAYVGDAACSRCHAEIVETFRKHPMGRSLAPMTPDDGDVSALPITFDTAGSRFTVERRGDRTIHREARVDDKGRVLAEVEAAVSYALGSGTRGVAYLVERDGRLFQSPITWYSQKRRWDISPGYEQENPHFDRPIEPGCLFCHADRVVPVDRTLNRYAEPIFRGHAIGCERCHGPGALHVRRPEWVDDRDPTIVNPRHLEPALRVAVCEQCHVLGVQRVERPGRSLFDYRPGLPTSAFFAIFGRADEAGNMAVDHVSQMKASRCFRESRGALDCTSCHDPHGVPAPREKLAYYRGQCLTCHEEKGCRLPRPVRLSRSPEDDCARCHMPRTPSVDIAHTATTDHRILRTPEAPPAVPSPPGDGSPLVLINDDGLSREDLASLDRELAIALASEGPRMPDTPRTRRIGSLVLETLDGVLAERPGDRVARRMKARVLALTGRRAEAIRQVEMVLKAAPDDEIALEEWLTYAIGSSDIRSRLARARQAVALDPWSATFHERLAYASVEAQDWDAALRESREALRIDPFLRSARVCLIQTLLQRDRNELRRAQQELATLIALHPALRGSLEQWYADQRRGTGR